MEGCDVIHVRVMIAEKQYDSKLVSDLRLYRKKRS